MTIRTVRKNQKFSLARVRSPFSRCHLMLDEPASQIFATTDDIAERVRKLGGATIRSIGHITRLQRVLDNDADYVTAADIFPR
jgi:starvation-inducible DNA-binding protein